MTPIFNSLGSNYSGSTAFAGFTEPDPTAHTGLIKLLEERYQGRVLLTYKGREALNLALQLIAKRDQRRQVVITGFTCYAVYEAVTQAGFKPVYLDIESGELNFSAAALKQLLVRNSNVGAVIVQNTLGFPADVPDILKICREAKVTLIEDLAHSIGTVYASGEAAGTLADFTALSFSQDKAVDGVSGGALVVRNNMYDISQLSSLLIPLSLGTDWRDRFYPFLTVLIRSTYAFGLGKLLHWLFKNLHLLSRPLTELGSQPHQLPNWYCQFILKQFAQLPAVINHRRAIAQIYAEQLDKKIILPALIPQINFSTALRFPVRVANRAALIQYLDQNGVYVSDIWYDAPVAPQKYLYRTDYRTGQCPNADVLSKEIINLPTHINISESQAVQVAELVNRWLSLHP